MTELVSKAILSGLGFMSLTREAIQQTVQHLVDQSKVSEAEGRRIVKEFERRSGRAQRKLEKHVEDAVHAVFKKLNLSTMTKRPTARKASKKRTAKRRRSTAAKAKSAG
jgi:polyhydroxyalkanoate synthesis regulator phasin